MKVIQHETNPIRNRARRAPHGIPDTNKTFSHITTDQRNLRLANVPYSVAGLDHSPILAQSA